jgi:hypothetical protein
MDELVAVTLRQIPRIPECRGSVNKALSAACHKITVNLSHVVSI